MLPCIILGMAREHPFGSVRAIHRTCLSQALGARSDADDADDADDAVLLVAGLARERDGEIGAFAVVRGHLDAAAVREHDLLGDEGAEAQASGASVAPPSGLEDVREHFARDGWTAVVR